MAGDERPLSPIPNSADRPLPIYERGSGPSGGEPHLSDYLRVIYKRRWPAVTAFLLVFVSACVYTFTATPIYDARVQILIEKEASNVVTFKEAIEQNQVADDYYQTQYRILQSRALARRTMDALSLWTNPQFTAAERSGGFLGWFSASTAKQSAPPSADETKDQSKSIDKFLANLTVSPIRNSRLVDVRFESSDPVLAANTTNALARSYIDQNLEYKFLSSKEASDWLGARLAEQRKQVENSEQALQQYREQTEAVSLEERQNIVVQKLADLNADRRLARRPNGFRRKPPSNKSRRFRTTVRPSTASPWCCPIPSFNNRRESSPTCNVSRRSSLKNSGRTIPTWSS